MTLGFMNSAKTVVTVQYVSCQVVLIKIKEMTASRISRLSFIKDGFQIKHIMTFRFMNYV